MTSMDVGKMWTGERVNCGPKVADRKCRPVGKMRTLILRTLGLRTNYGTFAPKNFFFRALPDHVVSATSVNNFKNRLDSCADWGN